jgi:hypothetical protein
MYGTIGIYKKRNRVLITYYNNMKLVAKKDVRIRTEEGKKVDFKKGDTMEVKYYDSVQWYLARGFSKVETKDMSDSVTAKSIKEEKEEVVETAKKTA